MNELLQLKICGIKNIDNEVTINFVNTTVDKGIKSVDRVKGIFGYNGAGKTAIITAVDIYKNIVIDAKYLQQHDVQEELCKIINYNIKKFSISVLYHLKDEMLLRHGVVLEYKDLIESYYIKEETISILSDRSINGKYKDIIKKNDNTLDLIDERFNSALISDIRGADLEMSSFVPYSIRRILSDSVVEEESSGFSVIKKLLLQIYFSANNIHVYLNQVDKHKGYKIDKEKIKEIYKALDYDKENYLENFADVYIDEEIISIDLLNYYEEENKKLEKFIKYFKPELKSIELIKREEKSLVHIRRLFKYEKYNVEYEFESSGIKQLVKLFGYLNKCASGGVVFVDEMDTNLNTAYFSALVSFFVNYSKGQLIFTTHNLEVMNSLKSKSKSILVLGIDSTIDVWVGKGNRSPIKDYLGGNIPNSPMNVEDFDFINIFFGEWKVCS